MIKTSTSVNKVNYTQQNQEINPAENVEALDLMFYDSIKPQLNRLTKNPSDETISKILAYSKAK
ncbi:hypothetical protein [Pedobacter frigoris]|uniref:Uncharacterized protein n=1 Tax=Pedobacter frigoris TaxID=2571272 RepID=A0A4U1CB48_9SPHI|nr:hypothetical protein [Pedobacter frigoris]TKC03753.1 hypothetical protein FA047_19530 [Pedobacter frigoris]